MPKWSFYLRTERYLPTNSRHKNNKFNKTREQKKANNNSGREISRIHYKELQLYFMNSPISSSSPPKDNKKRKEDQQFNTNNSRNTSVSPDQRLSETHYLTTQTKTTTPMTKKWTKRIQPTPPPAASEEQTNGRGTERTPIEQTTDERNASKPTLRPYILQRKNHCSPQWQGGGVHRPQSAMKKQGGTYQPVNVISIQHST